MKQNNADLYRIMVKEIQENVGPLQATVFVKALDTNIELEDRIFVLVATHKAEIEVLRKQLEALQAEISRYHLFAGALLADLNGEELTPAQTALKQTITDDKSKVFTIDDLNAACDAVLKASS